MTDASGVQTVSLTGKRELYCIGWLFWQCSVYTVYCYAFSSKSTTINTI